MDTSRTRDIIHCILEGLWTLGHIWILCVYSLDKDFGKDNDTFNAKVNNGYW